MSFTTLNKYIPENVFKNNQDSRKHSQNYREKPSFWKILILLSTVINYFITSFSYVFMQNPISGKVWFVIMALDVVYILNYIATLTNFFLRSPTIETHLQLSKSKFVLITDFFLAFPYSYFYETVSYKFYKNTIFLILRTNVLLRLFYLVSFFKKQWNTAGMNQLKCFAVQYTTYFLILVHTLACFWYVEAFTEDGSSKWSAKDFRKKYQQTFEKYVVCFYYAATSVTNRHFGDIFPRYTTQKIISGTFTLIARNF